MTSYKQMAQEAEAKLTAKQSEISELYARIEAIEKDILSEIAVTLPTEEARSVLHIFSSRAQNKEELVLLIRALSQL